MDQMDVPPVYEKVWQHTHGPDGVPPMKGVGNTTMDQMDVLPED